MRKGGLEPPHLSVPDPKSGASANSATFANAFSNFGGDSGYHVVIRFVTSDWVVTSLGKWFWVCLKNPSRSLLPPRRRAPVRNKPAESLRDRPQAFARGKQERPALRRKLFVRCESGFLFVLEPERKLVRVKRLSVQSSFIRLVRFG